MKKVPPRTSANDPRAPPSLPAQDAPSALPDRVPSPRSSEGEGEQRGHRRGPSATSGAPPLPERKTSPREGGAAKLKDAIAASKSAGALSPAMAADNAAARKSAFGQRMASHPQKKQSLANIFFMSSPLVRREHVYWPVVDLPLTRQHEHSKRGDLVEIGKAIGVRRTALSEAEFEQYVNSNANKNEQTALHVAVQHGHAAAAKLLVQLGASVVLRDINGRSPLLYSARYGRMELLQFFWERRVVGEEPDTDHQGDGMLHLAATNNHPEAVRFGVDQKLDVNAQNKFGETALHKAARTDNLTMVELLLSLGADCDVMGREGKPRHVAGSPAVAERLKGREKRGDSQSRTPVNVVDVDALGAEEDDSDDDDVEILIPGVRKIIATHGTSPNAELVHFKLKRRMEKEGPSSFQQLTSVSDEQLAVQHEVMRKKSLASNGSLEAIHAASSELAPPDAAAGVAIEMTLASGSPPRAGHVTHLFEPYRSMFGKSHFTFVSRLFGSSGPGSAPLPAIASVVAAPENGAHAVLLRSPTGYASYQLLADEVQHCREENSNCKLEEALRQVLERVLQCADDLESGGGGSVVSPTAQRRPTLSTPVTPKTQRVSVIRNLKNSLRGVDTSGGGVSGLWQLADSQALKMELLAVELKLGLPKTLTVGVVLVQPGQDEGTAMANNPMSKTAEQFLSSIATPTEALGYSGYTGGMSTREAGTFYYQGWRGMEIVFHVAPLLSENQRRQFIGNDKVLLYLLDGWREGRQLQPRFRGQVNSVGICVLPVVHPVYKFRAFHRMGMADTRPAFPEDPVELDVTVKDLLMSKIVNAHVESYHLLYSERMRRAWQEELAALVEKHAASSSRKQKKAGKGKAVQ